MTNIKEAIKEENIEVLDTLLPQIKCTEENKHFIFFAITERKPKSTEAIFNYCGNVYSDALDEYDNSPLKTAIYSYKKALEKNKKTDESLQILELTIKHSNDLDVKDKYHDTPISTASFLNLPTAVTLLLKHNATWTITDDTGNNALDKALWEENRETVEAFFAYNASLKDLPTLYKGQTPLTKMIYGQKISMIEFLLEQKVNVSAENANGDIAVEIAQNMEDQEILALLSQHEEL